jgi:hypothetical protein
MLNFGGFGMVSPESGALKRSMASEKMMSRSSGRTARRNTRSTFGTPSSFSRWNAVPTWCRRPIGRSYSTSRSTSLASWASLRATEPKRASEFTPNSDRSRGSSALRMASTSSRFIYVASSFGMTRSFTRSLPVMRWRRLGTRPHLGLRQVRERKRNEDYFPGCGCDHAASSSGRDQSTASAASASNAASPSTAAGSSKTVTCARRGLATWISPGNRTRPAASTSASTVWIIGYLRKHTTKMQPPSAQSCHPSANSSSRSGRAGISATACDRICEVL